MLALPMKLLLIGIVVACIAGSDARALERKGRSLLSISSPIIGYQQNVLVQVDAPANPGPNAQCILSGAPTPAGLSPPASGPLFLDIAQGTGTHFVDFSYNASLGYALAVAVQPGTSKLSADYSNSLYPRLAFQASDSSTGDVGLGTVVLYNGSSISCTAQIQFTVYTASCTFSNNGGSGGSIVVPQGPVYINPSYPVTIINQYNTIYNVVVNTNINVVSCTCCYNSCNHYSNNTNVPPTQAPPPKPQPPKPQPPKPQPPVPQPPVPQPPKPQPPEPQPPTTPPPTPQPPKPQPPSTPTPTSTPLPPQPQPPTTPTPTTTSSPVTSQPTTTPVTTTQPAVTTLPTTTAVTTQQPVVVINGANPPAFSGGFTAGPPQGATSTMG